MRQIWITLILLAVAPSCYAQSLWRDLPAGASVDQVRKLLPESNTVDDPSTLRTGAVGLLAQEGFQLAGRDFKATLFFQGGKLDRVFLNPVENPAGIDARVVARNLRQSLIAKYGPPTGSLDRTSSGSTTEWAQSGTIVTLTFNQYSDDGEGFIQVNYIAPAGLDNL